MFRMGLAAAIEEMDGIELVGEAERADEVPALVESAAPDVLLLDVRLADASGLEVNRWLAEHHPDVKVVMLTMSEDHDTAAHRAARRRQRVPRQGRRSRARRARRAHGRRRRRRARPVAGPRRDRAGPGAARRPTTRPFPQLTQREFDILGLVAEGLDNASIARRLVLSPKTVRNHVSNVFAKIQAPDRPGRSSSPTAPVWEAEQSDRSAA